jgi:hypothetical protein
VSEVPLLSRVPDGAAAVVRLVLLVPADDKPGKAALKLAMRSSPGFCEFVLYKMSMLAKEPQQVERVSDKRLRSKGTVLTDCET